MEHSVMLNLKFLIVWRIYLYIALLWSIEHFEIIAHLLKIIIDIDRYIDIDIERYRYKYINIHYGRNKNVTQNEFTISWSS